MTTAILSSFGKESLVVLKQALDANADIQPIYFYDRISRNAERAIKEWKLTVLGYAPAVRYVVEHEQGKSLVSEYSFGAVRMPMIQDITEQGQSVSSKLTPYFHYDFPETLWGYRKEDSHPLVSKTFTREFQLGATKMIAPLWDWTESDVMGFIHAHSIPYESEDDDVMCADLPIVPLATFRQRFDL